MTQPNGAFSPTTPGLQLVWDSTSLGALKECPYKYWLSIVRGLVPKTQRIDLEFGLFLHAGRERYYHGRANRQSHEEALTAALAWTLEATFNTDTNRPWTTGDTRKNRLTLVRTLVWYLDRWEQDPLETLMRPDGRPAVELTFRLPTGLQSSNGQAFELAGHIDRAATWNGHIYPTDLKTTKQTLSSDYFGHFSPDNQMSLYAWASTQLFQSASRGVIVDAAQIAVTFSRFERQIIPRSPDQLDEWLQDLAQWLQAAEHYARTARWPQNDKSCRMCHFRGPCAKPQSVREQWLAADFQTRLWDPTVQRGDI